MGEQQTRCRGGQRGMVTIELAIGTLTLALLTAFLIWLGHLGIVQAQCHQTAAQVARQVGRGDAAAAEQARKSAPAGSVVTVDTHGGRVKVTVRVATSAFGVDPVTIEGRADYPLEPGVR